MTFLGQRVKWQNLKHAPKITVSSGTQGPTGLSRLRSLCSHCSPLWRYRAGSPTRLNSELYGAAGPNGSTTPACVRRASGRHTGSEEPQIWATHVCQVGGGQGRLPGQSSAPDGGTVSPKHLGGNARTTPGWGRGGGQQGAVTYTNVHVHASSLPPAQYRLMGNVPVLVPPPPNI